MGRSGAGSLSHKPAVPASSTQRSIASFFVKKTPASQGAESPESASPDCVADKCAVGKPSPSPAPTPSPSTLTCTAIGGRRLAAKPVELSQPSSLSSEPLPLSQSSPPRSDDRPAAEDKEPSNSPSQPQPPPAGREAVGRRVSVYWPRERRWFEGRVDAFLAAKRKHVVVYDDGDRETLDLSTQKLRWLSEASDAAGQDCNGGKGADDSEKDEDARPTRRQTRASAAPRQARRKVTYIESDDDEGGGSGTSSSSESDGGVASDGDDSDAGSSGSDDSEDLVMENDEETAATARRSGAGGKRARGGGIGATASRRGGAPPAKRLASVSPTSGRGKENSPTQINGPARTAPYSIEKAQPSRKAAVAAKVLDVPVRMETPLDALNEVGEGRFESRNTGALKFLTDVRDAKRRKPGDEGYDPTTLFVPGDFLAALPPGQRQWWDFKRQHYDHVMLFKMGKFYEMFEMDAHVGARELGLEYMKGEQPHCGFPEARFSENAERLARKGYRVMVVEQTETPEQLAERRSSGSKDRVVRREVCQVLTRGTIVDTDMLAANPDPAYLLAVSEAPAVDGACWTNADNGQGSAGDRVIVGVCLLDAAAGRFVVGQLADDEVRSALRSLLVEYSPVEIVRPRQLSQPTEEALRALLPPSALWNTLSPADWWGGARTVDELGGRGYFCDADASASAAPGSPASDDGKEQQASAGAGRWLPRLVAQMRDLAASCEAALAALGACVLYLRRALLDRDLLRPGRIEPLPGFALPVAGGRSTRGMSAEEGCGSAGRSGDSGFELQDVDRSDEGAAAESDEVDEDASEPFMELGGATLENLEVLGNSRDGGLAGTLLTVVDHCRTPFGKRLLRQWLCRPLVRAAAIMERQAAVLLLRTELAEEAGQLRQTLASVPDLERLLARLHALAGGSGRNAERVVMYEDMGRKRLNEFLKAVRGCWAMCKATAQLEAALARTADAGCGGGGGSGGKGGGRSALLARLLATARTGRRRPFNGCDGGSGALITVLEALRESFDWGLAEAEGRVIPAKGVHRGYDRAQRRIAEVEEALQEHLRQQRRQLKAGDDVAFVTVGKDAYLLEVPERLLKHVPANFELKSSRKGFRRFWTPRIRQLLADMAAANEEREQAVSGILTEVVSRFCRDFPRWSAAVQAVAAIDCLCSLALASSSIDGTVCTPHIMSEAEEEASGPSFHAEALRHPAFAMAATGSTFVANDTKLGGSADDPTLILLTGPNMGGKSTLMRQVCLAAILAQIGADVPARSLSLSPVDRLFVRTGARDSIMTGQSTFLLELSETSAVLRRATRRSLVALDELGRGTSTADGCAIAYAVLRYLASTARCRGLFSTHYHRLAAEDYRPGRVALYHMACIVAASRPTCQDGPQACSDAPQDTSTDVLAVGSDARSQHESEARSPGGSQTSESGDVETVTFLYRLTPGVCPKSYGTNVALLAGMPESVVSRAAATAAETEQRYEREEQRRAELNPAERALLAQAWAKVSGVAS